MCTLEWCIVAGHKNRSDKEDCKGSNQLLHVGMNDFYDNNNYVKGVVYTVGCSPHLLNWWSNLASIVPRPSRGEEREGLVLTACACAGFPVNFP